MSFPHKILTNFYITQFFLKKQDNRKIKNICDFVWAFFFECLKI